MATICKHVHYSGQVQGVGFRYTARQVAQGFAVAGYVRNLPDGRVELMVEGESDQVEAFLEGVTRRMAGYITNTTIQDGKPSGMSGFTIRH